MTCEIRVSTKFNQGNDESLFSIENSSPDQAGAIVAIVARKAQEGQLGNDRYDIFQDVVEWLEKCPHWEFLPHIGIDVIYYYHIEIANTREGKPDIKIGFSQCGLAVRYCSVEKFVREVNQVRKDVNYLMANCQLPGLDSFYTPTRMLRLPRMS